MVTSEMGWGVLKIRCRFSTAWRVGAFSPCVIKGSTVRNYLGNYLFSI